ncbi:MAG: glycoside-pentoside-hexuronide (GPH):cation symporter, partial [Verrucomicrobiae bacterium]|nr:glycoside-pentoside-hexuronide (GPH):cation symporter [Verrucomicrobiae bacterium]
LFFKVFASFLVFFYTDVALVSAGAISVMLVVTRFFDALNDPVMGLICDRTKSPHGKFRPWLRWMILPYAVSGILLFTVPDLGETSKLIYVYATYTLALVFYTSINIPYGALMGVITPHSHERTSLATFRFYGAYASNFIVQGSILFLALYFSFGKGVDGNASQSGYTLTMATYAVTAAGLWLFVFYNTKERVMPPKGQKSDLKKDLSQLLQNKPWVAIVIIGVSSIIWIALRDAAILFYFKYYVVGQVEEGGRFEKLATSFNLLGTAATIAGVACTNFFTNILGGKKYAFFWLTVIVAFTAGIYYFAGPGDIALIMIIQAITSFLMGPLMPLFWSMIADTADYSEWKFGRRFTGLTFSAGTFSQKVGWAIGPALGAKLLDYYGYVPNAPQSSDTIQGLRMMMSVIPSVIGIGAAGLVLLYGINRKLEKQIEAELADRKTAEGTLDI